MLVFHHQKETPTPQDRVTVNHPGGEMVQDDFTSPPVVDLNRKGWYPQETGNSWVRIGLCLRSRSFWSVPHWDLRAGPAGFLGGGREGGLWRTSLVHITIQSHKENELGGTGGGLCERREETRQRKKKAKRENRGRIE